MHSEAMAHHHHDADSTDVFGFWLYIMTDCVLFGALFATFLVLHSGMAAMMAPKIHYNLQGVIEETFLLLASNFTYCLAFLSLYHNRLRMAQGWLIITFLFGLSFVVLEVREFIKLAHEGFSWNLSGETSSFFTLVGTHGLHVSFGLLWILVMIIQLPLLKSNIAMAKRRMTYLGLFWNFLDIVWIFVFTIVYLMGSI